MTIKQFILFTGAGMFLLPIACRQEEIPEDRGEKITLSFDLYKASLTKAESGMTEVLLPANTMLRAYAYKKGDPTTGNPVGYGDYTVDGEGKATGNLTLYRGDYDIYLVSNNKIDNVPEARTDNLIEVLNENDFMYSSLKNISVQPNMGGNDKMSVDLPDPFTRLCSKVIVKVKANESQPVGVQKLVVNSVKINKLPDKRVYQLGEKEWDASATPDYTGTVTFEGAHFTNNGGEGDGNVQKPRVSDPLVVLPLQGRELEFELSLNIKFNNGTDDIFKTFTYKPSVYKSFLPGMTYEFEFTLTFFGDKELSDLTMAILEYTTIKMASDDVGK